MSDSIDNLKTKWRCPSNIAVVKYWGKRPGQLPRNASLSMTLEHAFTECEVELTEKRSSEIGISYFFDDQPKPEFGERVRRFIETNVQTLPYVLDHDVVIRSTNSFPHSAGIASSASSFGALALALLDLSFCQSKQKLDERFYQQASFLARLGSGSASRSVYPNFAMWGVSPGVALSSDEFAVPVREIHPRFRTMRDAILIVDDQPKKVSSSAGHAMMDDNPFAPQRYRQANQRTEELVRVLQQGEMERFIELCEAEALALHALMMLSKDYFLLMQPGSLGIIERTMQFRRTTKIPVGFTLDAGPNVHLLYPEEAHSSIQEFVTSELDGFVKDVRFDQIGRGPERLSCS